MCFIIWLQIWLGDQGEIIIQNIRASTFPWFCPLLFSFSFLPFPLIQSLCVPLSHPLSSPRASPSCIVIQASSMVGLLSNFLHYSVLERTSGIPERTSGGYIWFYLLHKVMVNQSFIYRCRIDIYLFISSHLVAVKGKNIYLRSQLWHPLKMNHSGAKHWVGNRKTWPHHGLAFHLDCVASQNLRTSESNWEDEIIPWMWK